MQKTRYKHTVLTLLLMTFVGQALASSLSCCESLPFGNTGSSQLEHPLSGIYMPGADMSGTDGFASNLANGLILDKPVLADSSVCSTTVKKNVSSAGIKVAILSID